MKYVQLEASQIAFIKQQSVDLDIGNQQYTDKRPFGEYLKLIRSITGVDIAFDMTSLIGTKPSMLDIGCGMGEGLRTGREFFGLDGHYEGISTKMPQIISDGVHIQQGDAQRLNEPTYRQELGLSDNNFDVGFAIYVASYLADPLAMLEGFYALLKPGGKGYIIDIPSRVSYKDEKRELWEYLAGFGIKTLVSFTGEGPLLTEHQSLVIEKPLEGPELDIPVIASISSRRPPLLSYTIDRERLPK